MIDSELLKHTSLFSELHDEDLDRISDISLECRYRKNMIIFMEGEPGETVYYIKSGKVKIYRFNEEGKEHIIHLLGEGDVFGEATLFNSIPYPASAMTYEDCVLTILRNSDLEKLVRSNSELALNIIKVLTGKLVFAQQKIKELAFGDVFARTASHLLKLAHEYGSKTESGLELGLHLSRQELADMVGTTRETISRIISKFKKEKSISEVNDMIVILNETKLKSWI
ncbi:MAG: Crp/Fnr family transcriptional regulator [Bacillota bacterium]|nr:Crp/Fnr family transcriptional regulator [Bacillota bacterium]